MMMIACLKLTTIRNFYMKNARLKVPITMVILLFKQLKILLP